MKGLNILHRLRGIQKEVQSITRGRQVHLQDVASQIDASPSESSFHPEDIPPTRDEIQVKVSSAPRTFLLNIMLSYMDCMAVHQITDLR